MASKQSLHRKLENKLQSPAIKFFRTGLTYVRIYIDKKITKLQNVRYFCAKNGFLKHQKSEKMGPFVDFRIFVPIYVHK